jgi:hypothetical protein
MVATAIVLIMYFIVVVVVVFVVGFFGFVRGKESIFPFLPSNVKQTTVSDAGGSLIEAKPSSFSSQYIGPPRHNHHSQAHHHARRIAGVDLKSGAINEILRD